MDKADHEHVYRCQDCGEQFEDSTYRTVILDAEKQRWIGEVKAALPNKKGIRTDMPMVGSYDNGVKVGFDRALDAVGRVLDTLQ